MNKIYNALTVIFSGLLLFNSCEYKKTALGDDMQIFVFADSLLWLEIKEDVQETFYNYVFTPRAEKSFILSHRSLDKLNDLKGRQNLLFIGTLEKGSPVNDYLLSITPPEFVSRVENNNGFYFFKDNLFLQNQISLFMLAKNKNHFKENFLNNKRDIFNNFNKKYMARLEERMFEKGEQKDLEDYLIDNFGYKVRVQHDYFLATQEPDEKYVWLRRLDPDRWISIWKRDQQDVGLSADSLFHIRNEMAAKYYDGDVIVDEETTVTQEKFADWQIKKLTGTWKNDSLLVGGPFRTYVIPRPEEKAFYFVDIAVMEPTKDKKPFLDQLEVIAHTFNFINK